MLTFLYVQGASSDLPVDLVDPDDDDPALPEAFLDAATFHQSHRPVEPQVRRYTRYSLRCVLQVMGCKPQHAHQIAGYVFSLVGAAAARRHLASEAEATAADDDRFFLCADDRADTDYESDAKPTIRMRAARAAPGESDVEYCATFSPAVFLGFMRATLVRFQYSRPEHLQDFKIGCSVQDGALPIIVLFAGASGCGKSTLASLLACRLGISTVLSTDNVRHLLRTYTTRSERPILWASTYNAGESIDGEASERDRVIRGYEDQNELVFAQIDHIISKYESRRESLIVEGVHLSPRFLTELMRRHRSCVPFVVHISNESKHRERFAIRAKYMTLEPRHNRYVKYFENIRLIQHYISKGAEKHAIPRIDNTNVDRSIATVHRVLLESLRILARGDPLFDPDTAQTTIPDPRKSAVESIPWSSKSMLRVIRLKANRRRRKVTVLDGAERTSPRELSDSAIAAPRGRPRSGSHPNDSRRAVSFAAATTESESALSEPAPGKHVHGFSTTDDSESDGGAVRKAKPFEIDYASLGS